MEEVSFDANDRCDRCGAQAYWKALKDDLELLFCAHHHRECEEKLFLTGWVIIGDHEGIKTLAGQPG